MRQNEIPPASRLLNSTEAKQDLLGVTSIERMVKWGAPVRAEERKFLLDYLSAYYGPQRSMGSSSAETERQLAPYK